MNKLVIMFCCVICESMFEPSRSRAKYCSDMCRSKAAKRYQKKYREVHRSKARIYNKEYGKKYYKENKENISKRIKIYQATGRGKKVLKRSYEKRKKLHPEKILARQRISDAIKSGRSIKCPCGICGELKSEGHHRDYELPLDVVWLCRKHHTEIHKNLTKAVAGI